MATNLKSVVIAATFLLTLFFVTPIGVSLYYGGDPPPFIARMLERNNETFNQVALKFFSMFEQLAPKK
jgi:hypothetical protein